MSKISNLKDLINEAAEMEDQTQVSTFTGSGPAAEGKTVGRFIEYIELGLQPQAAFKGKAKEPAENVRLVFELLGKKNQKEIEVDGEAKTITDKIYVTIKKSFNEKAKFKKLFDKMRYGREKIKHIAQMLGEGFVITVVHRTSKKDAKKVYANITSSDGSWMIEAPFAEDPETGERKTYKVPEATADMKLFLFNKPTQETWDSLYIDGEGKNFIQETIQKALNFKGSALEEMIAGGIETHEDVGTGEVEIEEDNGEVELEEEVETPPAKKTTVAKPTAKPPVVAKANAAVQAVASKAPTASSKKPTPTTTKAAPKASVKAVVAAKSKAPAEDPLAALGLAD